MSSIAETCNKITIQIEIITQSYDMLQCLNISQSNQWQKNGFVSRRSHFKTLLLASFFDLKKTVKQHYENNPWFRS